MHEIIKRDLEACLRQINLEPLRDKTVLVTGSNGLIGTYLVCLLWMANNLSDLNTRVICVSRNEPNESLRALKGDPNFAFHSIDLTSGFDPAESIDYVIHGATYAQPGRFLEDKLTTMKLNTYATEALLELCARYHASFLFLSSADVYGHADDIHVPTPESYSGACSTTGSRAAYGESKRMGETLCSVFRDAYGVDAKIARISATYGPGLSIYDQRVMGNFLNNALRKGHIDLLDDGQQVRTFCYISDCVVMLYNILLYGQEFIYNVGGRDTISIHQLAEIIGNLTSATYSVQNGEQPRFRRDLPDRVQLDISRVTQEFGLTTFVEIHEGVRNTIAWNLDTILSREKLA